MSSEQPPDSRNLVPQPPEENEGDETPAEEVPPGPIPPEVLQGMPTERQREVQSTFAAMATSVGPMPHPLADKVTPEHITEMIKDHAAESQRDHDDRKDQRRWTAYITIFVSLVMTGLIVFLVTQNEIDVADDLLRFGLGAIAGFGGGYGFAKRRG